MTETNTNTALERIDYDALSGAGFENTSEKDLSLPFISLLQALSPEVNDPSRRIKDAAAGMFLNTSTKQVFSALNVVPLFVTHAFVEWVPRSKGGGFKGLHAPGSDVVVAAQRAFEANPSAEKKLSKHLLTAAGNNLVETKYVWCLLLEEDGQTPVTGIVIPFKSTALKVYKKDIYTPCYSMKGANGRPPPLFSHRLRVTSVTEQHPDGISFNFRVQPLMGSLKDSQIPQDSPLARIAYETYKTVAARQDELATAQANKGNDVVEAPADEVFS